MNHIQHDDDESLFDENGILRDGKTWRVPLHMADSLQREVARHASVAMTDAAHNHRPGFRLNNGNKLGKRYVDHDMDWLKVDADDPREQAYRQRDAALRDAWRGDKGGADEPGALAAEDAYALRDEEMVNAWKKGAS